MHFDQDFFIFLAFNWPQRANARPIKDAKVVKIALGAQQLAFAERLALFHVWIGDVAQEFGLGVLRA